MDAAIWPNPCGQVVDVLRSCYEVGMIFVDGGPTVQVKWFRADPDAKYLDVATPFASTIWQDAKSKFADLGEQAGPRPWRNGAGPTALKGKPTCPKDRAMEGIGIPYDPPRPLSSEGQPICCGPVPPPMQTCCPLLTTPTLVSRFPAGQGCPCMDGVTVSLTFNPVSHRYEGSVVCCSSELVTLSVHCEGTDENGWMLDATMENHGTVNDIPVNSPSCSPFSLRFLWTWPVQGAECDGATNLVVTVT